MKNISFFNGSPGSLKDFNEISHELRLAKKTLIAYSYGCLRALEFVDEFERVIFISPYTQVKVSFLKKIIFSIRFLAMKILDKKRNSILKDFFDKSFFGGSEESSKAYKKYVNSITNKELYDSVVEKINYTQGVSFKQSKTKLLVIFGDQDKTIDLNSEKKALSKMFDKVHFQVIENASHALAWSHKEKLIEVINRSGGEGND